MSKVYSVHNTVALGHECMLSLCSHSLLSKLCCSAGSPLLKGKKGLYLVLGHAAGDQEGAIPTH